MVYNILYLLTDICIQRHSGLIGELNPFMCFYRASMKKVVEKGRHYGQRSEYASVLGVDLCRVAQADMACLCVKTSISSTPGLCAVTESRFWGTDMEPTAMMTMHERDSVAGAFRLSLCSTINDAPSCWSEHRASCGKGKTSPSYWRLLLRLQYRHEVVIMTIQVHSLLGTTMVSYMTMIFPSSFLTLL